MSGDIAVADDLEGKILARTLEECVARNWTEVKTFGAGFNKVTITEKDRRVATRSQSN